MFNMKLWKCQEQNQEKRKNLLIFWWIYNQTFIEVKYTDYCVWNWRAWQRLSFQLAGYQRTLNHIIQIKILSYMKHWFQYVEDNLSLLFLEHTSKLLLGRLWIGWQTRGTYRTGRQMAQGLRGAVQQGIMRHNTGRYLHHWQWPEV